MARKLSSNEIGPNWLMMRTQRFSATCHHTCLLLFSHNKERQALASRRWNSVMKNQSAGGSSLIRWLPFLTLLTRYLVCFQIIWKTGVAKFWVIACGFICCILRVSPVWRVVFSCTVIWAFVCMLTASRYMTVDFCGYSVRVVCWNAGLNLKTCRVIIAVLIVRSTMIWR